VVWGRNFSRTIFANLNTVMAVAMGNSHAVALLSNGTVSMFGTTNSFGQLNVPSGLSGVTQVAAGDTYSLAISGGRVVGWPDSEFLPVGL